MRAEAPRVAHGDDPVVDQHDQRVGALPRGQRALDAVLPRLAAGGGQHQREHLGVAGGGEAEALAPAAPRAGADALTRLPLWATASGPCMVSTRNGWMVAVRVGAGGAVAGVADGVVAGERGHRGRGEHVGHQAGVLVAAHPAAVADGDAGGLLAAVLQREQAEERELARCLRRGAWRRRRRRTPPCGPSSSARLMAVSVANVDGRVRKHARCSRMRGPTG